MEGPELPAPRTNHCSVKINNALLIVIGGAIYNGTTYVNVNDTWIYSWPDEMWTQAPDLPTARHDYGCGIFTDKTGVRHVLVAGWLIE